MAHDQCDLLCLDLPRAESLRAQRLDGTEATRLAAQASALGDPTRLQVALALRDGGELCVCDLAWIVERSQKLVSHHVRLLRSAGLADSRRDGRMVMYALTATGEARVASLVSKTAATNAAR